MGLLYQVTKSLPIPVLQGLVPTTLEELLDKLGRLQQQGIQTKSIEVMPEMEEGIPESLFGRDETLYFLLYVAHLANGRTTEARVPVPMRFEHWDPLKQLTPDDPLIKLAEMDASLIRERGYKAKVNLALYKDHFY